MFAYHHNCSIYVVAHNVYVYVSTYNYFCALSESTVRLKKILNWPNVKVGLISPRGIPTYYVKANVNRACVTLFEGDLKLSSCVCLHVIVCLVCVEKTARHSKYVFT